MNQKKPGANNASIPGFFRRIAAIFYDSLLLLAVLFSATAILLPLNSGEAFSSRQIYYPIYLFFISFFFYGWFWTHGGQTLGLRAWKIKVLTNDHKQISWPRAFLRFTASLLSWLTFGCGFLWIFISKNRLAWHDSLSQTRIFFDHNQ